MLVNSSDNIVKSPDLALAKNQADPVRTAVRFPIQLPINLLWAEGEMSATTVDISACGLLFVAEKLLPINSRVEFSIPMPSEILGTDSDVVVSCVGRVVRSTSHPSQAVQTAVVIDEYSFRT